MVDVSTICSVVTKKPVKEYLDNGHYIITESQAKKLCGGKLPSPGYEKHMMLENGKPAPSFHIGTTIYVIGETKVSCRVGIKNGYHWTIRAY